MLLILGSGVLPLRSHVPTPIRCQLPGACLHHHPASVAAQPRYRAAPGRLPATGGSASARCVAAARTPRWCSRCGGAGPRNLARSVSLPSFTPRKPPPDVDNQ